MRRVIAACAIASMVPDLALAEGNKGGGSGRGSGIMHDTGGNRTPGENNPNKQGGQQGNKTGGQQGTKTAPPANQQ